MSVRGGGAASIKGGLGEKQITILLKDLEKRVTRAFEDKALTLTQAQRELISKMIERSIQETDFDGYKVALDKRLSDIKSVQAS